MVDMDGLLLSPVLFAMEDYRGQPGYIPMESIPPCFPALSVRTCARRAPTIAVQHTLDTRMHAR